MSWDKVEPTSASWLLDEDDHVRAHQLSKLPSCSRLVLLTCTGAGPILLACAWFCLDRRVKGRKRVRCTCERTTVRREPIWSDPANPPLIYSLQTLPPACSALHRLVPPPTRDLGRVTALARPNPAGLGSWVGRSCGGDARSLARGEWGRQRGRRGESLSGNRHRGNQEIGQVRTRKDE